MIMKIDFLKPVVPYVLYHHERYDGRVILSDYQRTSLLKEESWQLQTHLKL
jgi:hypothetical protein